MMWYNHAKRVADIALSAIGIVLTLPVVIIALLAVWLQDLHSPIYLATRTGKGGRPFLMYKIRSMKSGADKSGVYATAKYDTRITPVGSIVRACKLDEIMQLWNVLMGQMSIVGPRPLAPSETSVYTTTERQILSIGPGITDIASIVFADEGSILDGSIDPSGDYDRLIRPWKSRLALLYVEKQGPVLDLALVLLTVLAVVHRNAAMGFLRKILVLLGAEDSLVEIATGETAVRPVPPPGQEAACEGR